VKVKFPTLADDKTSTWARVASPGASSGHGLQLLPEVDDEVVVVFEQGDLRRPVVIGSLWSDQKKPPYGNDKLADSSSGVFTRAWKTKQGHLVEFVDKPGTDAKITVKLGDGSGSLVMNSDGITLKSTGKLDLEGDKGVTLKSSTGTVAIEAQQAVSIKSDTDAVNIASLSGVSLKADAGDIQSQGLNVKATAELELSLQSTGPAAIKGMPLQLN
jgi:uncharacterized protein involved in type VI secretion and phage assembly